MRLSLTSALVGCLVFCAVCVSGAWAAGSPLFTPVLGSPFGARVGASSVAFNASGGLLAFADPDGTTVARVAVSGALSPVSVSAAASSLEFPETALAPTGNCWRQQTSMPGRYRWRRCRPLAC